MIVMALVIHDLCRNRSCLVTPRLIQMITDQRDCPRPRRMEGATSAGLVQKASRGWGVGMMMCPPPRAARLKRAQPHLMCCALSGPAEKRQRPSALTGEKCRAHSEGRAASVSPELARRSSSRRIAGVSPFSRPFKGVSPFSSRHPA